MIIFAEFFLGLEMFQTEVVEKIKTQILCLITPPLANLAVYEIMRKNMVESERLR
jgi:hypothetical protein